MIDYEKVVGRMVGEPIGYGVGSAPKPIQRHQKIPLSSIYSIYRIIGRASADKHNDVMLWCGSLGLLAGYDITKQINYSLAIAAPK